MSVPATPTLVRPKKLPVHSPHIWISCVCAVLTAMVQADTGQSEYWTLPVPAQGQPAADMLWPMSSLSPEDCGLCHPKQLDEWRTSWHAKASSPGLLGQLPAFDDETRTMCLNCHAPRTEQQESASEPAALADVGGVDCAACHVRAHQRFGPSDRATTPHGSVLAEPLFWSADFCAPCHQFTPDDVAVNGKLLENTHEEWRASRYAGQGITCQDCHMPDRSHRFRGIHDPDMLRKGLALDVDRTQDGITATLTNHGAGHALPTYITPKIRLRIYGQTPSAPMELVIQRSMHWSPEDGWEELADTRLMPGESRSLSLALDPDSAGSAQVIVEPDADYHDRVYPYLIANLQDEISPAAMARLRAAHADAAASPYTAYRVDCGTARDERYRCGP